MKKALLVLTAGVFSSGVAFGDFVGSNADTQSQQGVYIGPGAHPSKATVADAKNKPDDTMTTVQGNIVEKIGKDKYTLKDSTGQMTVEIDDKYLPNQNFNEKNVVEVSGEIDKDFMKPTELDAKRPVKIVQ